MIKLSCKLNTILNKYIIFNSIYFIIGLKSIQIFSKSLMAIYLITGLFFLALFIFNFFTTKKIKKNIIIIFISVIFIFYIFEFYLNLKKNKITNLYNQIINIYYLNKHNSTIASGGYLFLGRENLDILPMSGISNKKTFLCNEDGFFSSYLSDRYGFRNDNNIYDKKEEYIILIGDSYVHGACQDNESIIPGYLIKKNLNILNLGYSSTGPLFQYAILREYADLKRTKKIYYFFYSGNDIYNDFKREEKNYILKKYLSDKKFSQNLKNKQKFMNNIYENANDELISELSEYIKQDASVKNKFNCFIRLCNLRSTSNPLFYNSRLNSNENYEGYFKILEEIKSYTESNGVEFIFVYVPNFYEFKFFSNLFYQFQYDKIMKYLIDKKITFIDIKKEIISSKVNYLTFYPNEKFGHYNKLGYQFISEQIFKFHSKN